MARWQATAAVEAPLTAVAGDRRDAILDGAATVISRRGYAATTVPAIAAAAGVAVADFERCFDDKEDCFLAVYDEAVARIEGWVRADLAGWDGDWTLGLRRAVRVTADLLDADPRLGHVCGREALFAGPRGMQRHRATVARLVPALRAGRGLSSDPEALPEDLERTLLSGAIVSLGSARRAGDLVRDLTYLLLVTYMDVGAARRLAEDA